MNEVDIQRVLVLGNSGFIGSRLERMLKSRFPEIEVTGCSAPAVDLSREEETEKLAGLLDRNTAVIACAAIKRQFGDNLEAFSQNMRMSINLCRLIERRPVGRLVFFSSAAVYGEEIHNTAITEETPANPRSFYGIAKFSAERLLQNAVRGSLLILRPPVIYGPGDTGSGYGPSGFVQAALAGEPITLWGDGSEQREFIFIDDAVQIVSRLALGGFAGVLNLASGRSYSYLDILKSLSRMLPGKVQTKSRPRTKEKVDHGFRNSLLMKLLPDLSFTPPAEGLRRLIAADLQRA